MSPIYRNHLYTLMRALKRSIMQLFPQLAISEFLLGNLFSMWFMETLSFPLFLFHTFIYFSIYLVFNKILLRKDSYLLCTATALTPCQSNLVHSWSCLEFQYWSIQYTSLYYWVTELKLGQFNSTRENEDKGSLLLPFAFQCDM